MTGLEVVVQMLRELPVTRATTDGTTTTEDGAYYACTRKRLLAELQRLQSTQWAAYVVASRQHHPRRGIFLTLSIAMNRERTLLVEFPETYPFHAPAFQLAEQTVPCAMALAGVLTRFGVPLDIRPLIVSFLRHTRLKMLKRYVHDYWLDRGEMSRLAHVMQRWDRQLSPKEWSPGNSVAHQLREMRTFLDDIGLTFTTPPTPAAAARAPLQVRCHQR